MIVLDTSAMVEFLVGADPIAERVRAVVEGGKLAAPHAIDLECAAALRGLVRGQKLPAAEAERALELLGSMRLQRYGHVPLLARIWQLRHNMWPYDAAYVALAEGLDAELVTLDGKIETIPGVMCSIRNLRGLPATNGHRAGEGWARDVTPVFRNTLRRWQSTVEGLRNSCAAMSRLLPPSRPGRAICLSWGVRSSRVWAVAGGRVPRRPAARSWPVRRRPSAPWTRTCRARCAAIPRTPDGPSAETQRLLTVAPTACARPAAAVPGRAVPPRSGPGSGAWRRCCGRAC